MARGPAQREDPGPMRKTLLGKGSDFFGTPLATNRQAGTAARRNVGSTARWRAARRPRHARRHGTTARGLCDMRSLCRIRFFRGIRSW